MKEYDKIILNKLLDTYESSTLYKGTNERNISISFKFTVINLPEYFDQTSSIYEDVHGLMHKLEEKCLIRIIWKNNKTDHIITKVTLDLDHLGQAYHYVKRQPKSSKEKECEEILANYSSKNDTMLHFCNWANRQISLGLSVKRFFDVNNTKDLRELLEGVVAVTNNAEDFYIRELSILIYHDSKKLEALIGRIESVIKEFHPNKDHFTQNYDFLSEFNISRNPVWIMFKGAGSLYLKNSNIKLSDFQQGIGLSGNDLQNIDIKREEAVKRVVTVENLTSFHRINIENTLVIYLAGFHNRVRRELLKRIYKVYGDADYYHWGDIDVGGFKIYFDLCKKTGIPFRMLWMDVDTLDKYKDFSKKLTTNDKKELSQMLNNNEYSEILLNQKAEFDRVIKTMLAFDIKLEQEIIHEEFLIN